jgi:hypothetical protein
LAARLRVRTNNEFTEGNDPHREHDFVSFELNGQKVFWKIDCYDCELKYGSKDPSDPIRRVGCSRRKTIDARLLEQARLEACMFSLETLGQRNLRPPFSRHAQPFTRQHRRTTMTGGSDTSCHLGQFRTADDTGWSGWY